MAYNITQSEDLEKEALCFDDRLGGLDAVL